MLTLDWDGDGRTDILGSDGNIYLSTGTGFGPGQPSGIPSGSVLVAFDANGDGLDDIGAITFSGSTVPFSYYLHNGSGNPPDLATSFADGFGVTQTVTYAPADWGSHTKQATATYPNVDYQGPITLVTSVQSSDGGTGNFTSTYTY
jgi:hypothetical protein